MRRIVFNLSLARKMAVIGAVALTMVAIPSALAIRSIHLTLCAASAATTGLVPAADVLTLIRLTQQHRRQTALLLRGDEARRPAVQASRAAVDQAMAMVRASIGEVDHGAALAGRVDALQRSWRALADAVGSLDRSDAVDTHALADAVGTDALADAPGFAWHGAVLSEQLALLDAIVDTSTLALDAVAGTHHLIDAVFHHLPRLTVSLGQLRASGAAATGGGGAASEEARMLIAATTELARLHARNAYSALSKSMAADPSIRVALEHHVVAARRASTGWLQVADERLAGAHATPAIDAQFALIEAAFRTLDPVLRDRVVRERRLVWAAASGMAVIGALGLWLIVLTVRTSSGGPTRREWSEQPTEAGDFGPGTGVTSKDEAGQLLSALSALKAMNQNLIGMAGRTSRGTESVVMVNPRGAGADPGLPPPIEAGAALSPAAVASSAPAPAPG